MYSSFQLAHKYLNYYLHAYNSKGHGMHSPFVFQFILQVLNNNSGFHPPQEIEGLREQLKKDKTVLDIEDFGAGSRVSVTKQRSVQQLAASALKPKKYAHLLFRLVSYFQPKTIIELGTSLGVTTSYLSAANPTAAITTIEGSKAIAQIAAVNFAKLGFKNIQLLQGNFDDLLPSVLNQNRTVDLVYIDGNHRYGPTINYFHQALDKIHNDTIIVFDDIHWSSEMEQAWEEIKNHPAVKCTVDIFFLGFVFFRAEFKTRQHFSVRY